ncbi:carbamoyltransferase HypF [Halomonas cerina]|uniref:Carbamoyltransferase HypF n=1 Tax=Halomonas cerina TaxID=447424 RepID=A0A839VE96_9GAMM|nr:hydrogenase maturation protein HypF [Halomonas cerina]
MATAMQHPGPLASAVGVGGEAIRVRGLVQGVGFRPAVWRLARDLGLTGEVRNDAEGVLIRLWGERAVRERFRRRLPDEAPPLARIDSLETTPLDDGPPPPRFHIATSAGGEVHTGIVADAATCAACLAEVFDPADRRYRYAFANCTHCGPRLSIVHALPYDRAATSMAAFPLCPRCRAEYHDPADRRFHAQPTACPACGPRLWLEATGAEPFAPHTDPLAATQRLLEAGHIVAIKGIGGFHLAVDATHDAAVARLRQRKRRPDKPLALMVRDVAMLRRYCRPTDDEHALMQGPAAPIVLLAAEGPETLARGVAPGQRHYGVMLPASPLHHLLMADLEAPIVLTSGNRAGEPPCRTNQEARQRLAGIADALLLHDRDIVDRLDDSVVRWVAGVPTLLRRARGYVPTPLALPAGFEATPSVLALGGELKHTFCLLKDAQALLSAHLGNRHDATVDAAHLPTLARYLALFDHRPQVLAIDPHPDYRSSREGRDRAAAEGLALVEVQHHHAHLAACLADNGLARNSAPVLGIALDGTGYGDDGTLWGGELLLADYRGYRRLASLAPVALPGGTQAIRQPWRLAYAHLYRGFDWAALAADHRHLAFFQALEDQPLATLACMLDSGFNSPSSSACGRLFDAVAALLGLCLTVSYEGQAAIELEAAVDPRALDDGHAYPFTIVTENGLPRLEPQPMWQSLLDDLCRNLPIGVMAARFHAGLADGLAAMVDHLQGQHGVIGAGRIALSGGVFQNAVLGEALIQRLETRGWQVLRHERVPTNDGGLSLGQAIVAAARTLAPPEDSSSCV